MLLFVWQRATAVCVDGCWWYSYTKLKQMAMLWLLFPSNTHLTHRLDGDKHHINHNIITSVAETWVCGAAGSQGLIKVHWGEEIWGIHLFSGSIPPIDSPVHKQLVSTPWWLDYRAWCHVSEVKVSGKGSGWENRHPSIKLNTELYPW